MGRTSLRILLLVLILMLSRFLTAQKDVPEWDERGFFNLVLSDITRNEPDLVVYNIKVGSYIGPVITEPVIFLWHLELLGVIKEADFGSLASRQLAIDILIRGDTLPLDSESRLMRPLEFPPQENRYYRYLNKSRRKVIRTFFDKDLNFKMPEDYKDELAIYVVLFKHRIPLCRSGYGFYLDTKTPDWSDSGKPE